MEIATVLSVHDNVEVAVDTLESILHYATDKVMILNDGLCWEKWENLPLPVFKLNGFNHGLPRAPYRNVALGLSTAYKTWPDVDWICYVEYDVLFGSSFFKKDLEESAKEGYTCIGNDLRVNQEKIVDLSFLEKIAKGKFKEAYYLLGACVFYHNDFLKKAMEEEYFDRFLFLTNEFKDAEFPFYTAWDISEHALPTLAAHYGGKVKQFAGFNDKVNMWSGNYRKYPIRYRPELEYKDEYFLQAAIMHPLKTFDHPIRKFHRAKRQSQQS